MGAEVSSQSYSREERQRYREKVRQNLDVFEKMLNTSSFEFDRPMTGLEIELNLVDADMQPHFHNAEVLAAIADEDYQTELAQYNIELNVPPRPLPGDSALELETDLRASLNRAAAKAQEVGSKIVAIGILPTIMPEHYEGEWISRNNRYTALNDSIFVARGEDIYLDIEGPLRGAGRHVLRLHRPRVGLHERSSSTCRSRRTEFADHWNAAQALVRPAGGPRGQQRPSSSGKRLHAETRIELFKQATDTRPIELKNQGVRPRVFFGERWITSIFDLFEENVRYFPALLAETTDEDPIAKLEAGIAPDLAELRLHNGTVYRWNRPIYDTVGGVPHLRVENRVLPAGPTIADVLANAAFYYGCIRVLAHQDRPVWTKLSFSAAAGELRPGRQVRARRPLLLAGLR
jgi:hypothetical protein